jgi:uncharacterized membrane protein
VVQVIDLKPVPARAVPLAAVRGAVARKRVGGIDVARGVAVLAMFAVHLGPDPSDGGVASLLQIAPGRAQALFILLSGVSIALLSGGRNPAAGQAMPAAVIRIVVRAVLLLPLGLLLTALGTDISIILTYYALFFLLALPAIRLPARRLAALAAGLTLLAPLVSFLLRASFWPSGWSADLTSGDVDFSNILTPHGLAVLVLLGAYPALTSMPFVFAGMAIGRLDLRNPDVAARLLAVGAGLAVLGYGASWLALHPLGGLHHVLASVPAHDRAAATADPFGGFDGFVPTTSIAWLLSSAPYSGTPFWIAGAGGIAIFVLGACLLLTRPGTVQHPAMAQLANLGSMVLSAYALHIVASAILPDTDTAVGEWVELVGVSSAILLFAETWRRRVSQRGPLETVLHVWSTRAAGAVLGNEGDARPEPARPTRSTMTPDVQETVTR